MKHRPASRENNEQLVLGAAQLLLSEKRTSLSLMRTGIAVIALPLAVIGALIATSSHYNVADVLNLFIAVMIFNALLAALGAYLIARAMRGMHHAEQLLAELKRSHPDLKPFLD